VAAGTDVGCVQWLQAVPAGVGLGSVLWLARRLQGSLRVPAVLVLLLWQTCRAMCSMISARCLICVMRLGPRWLMWFLVASALH
jgi:hypothetical protein